MGPLRTYFRRATNLAFDHASCFDDKDIEHQEFVVIAESLGSFIIDAFNNLFEDSNSAEQVGLRTMDLYFFSNQFALLELGRIDGVPAQTEGGRALAASIGGPTPIDLLKRWAQSGRITAKLAGEAHRSRFSLSVIPATSSRIESRNFATPMGTTSRWSSISMTGTSGTGSGFSRCRRQRTWGIAGTLRCFGRCSGVLTDESIGLTAGSDMSILCGALMPGNDIPQRALIDDDHLAATEGKYFLCLPILQVLIDNLSG